MAVPFAPCPVRRVVRDEAPVGGGRLRAKRADRFFRDINGIESAGSHALVLGRVRRHAASDDASWPYWTVVCADRGGVRSR